jgi:hypothetical protein
MYFLNIFPETLHVSADVSHHQVYATTVEIQVIKVKYTTELNSDLKRMAIEHSCSFTTIKLVLYNVLKISSG